MKLLIKIDNNITKKNAMKVYQKALDLSSEDNC